MMRYPFTMRRATPADREAVVGLCRSIWPDDWVPFAYDDFMEEAEPSGLYLAEQEGRLIGCYHLSITPTGDAHFSAMRIDPNVQGRGFGKLFCRAQVEQARNVRAGNIYLISMVDNPKAHRTVEKNGFENLGEWVIYDDLKEVRSPGAVRRARPVRPEDLPRVREMLAGLDAGALGSVISSETSPWAVQTVREVDWNVERMAVVDGEGGLEGLMLLGLDGEGGLIVRRLEGTPEAAADLLAYAAREMERQGLTAWNFSLPTRCEPLLAPLGLDPAKAFRAYVFCLPAGKALPAL